jgi:rod shape determining protein RodA
VAIALFSGRCRYESLLKWHWLTYLLTNLSLIAVIILGVTANGAQSWINIGSFNVQPSEFAKVGLIITLAALLHHRPADNLFANRSCLCRHCHPLGVNYAQCQPGTGLVFGAITLGMIYWANAKLPWMIILLSPIPSVFLFNLLFPAWIVLAIIIAVLAWFTLPYRFLSTFLVVATNLAVGKLGEVFWGLLKEYQKNRLTLFLDPEKNPLGGGYQLIQSRIAIGSGELLGRGLHQGTQTQLNFIPEQHTDFIFTVVGEELGFVGSILVLIAFWLVCWRLLVIANTAKENFGSLIAIGVLSDDRFSGNS